MNIYTKLFITAIFMFNVCIYVLFLEKYFNVDTAFIIHIVGSIIVVLFHLKLLKLDREVIKNKEDESVSN